MSGLDPFAKGPLPSFLEGNQSAESWGNTMHDLAGQLQSMFTTLGHDYPTGYQAYLNAQAPPAPPVNPVQPAGFYKGDTLPQGQAVAT